jgi:hypothetical protein
MKKASAGMVVTMPAALTSTQSTTAAAEVLHPDRQRPALIRGHEDTRENVVVPGPREREDAVATNPGNASDTTTCCMARGRPAPPTLRGTGWFLKSGGDKHLRAAEAPALVAVAPSSPNP